MSGSFPARIIDEHAVWVRALCRGVLRSRFCLPLAACIAFVLGFGLVLSKGLTTPSAMFVVGICICSAFVAGYAKRMNGEWPHLHEFRRSQYGEVWDALSVTPEDAAKAAAGISEEHALQASGVQIAARIAQLTAIKSTDDVLEIGCGVGRVGGAMAKICRCWIGCDISRKMIAYATQRFRHLPNTRLIHLGKGLLSEISDESVDVVYCTNAIPHFDRIQRWQYVVEAHRILRPSGRCYIDSIALDSPEGWLMMKNNWENRRKSVDPPYSPDPSTSDEILAYFGHAGFCDVRIEKRESLLAVIGIKK